MTVPKSRRFILTLIYYVVLALVLTDVVQATGYAHVPVRRDHAYINRITRKRGSAPRDLIGVVGAGNDPPVVTSSPTPTVTPTTSPTLSPTSTSTTPTTTTATTPTSTSSTGVVTTSSSSSSSLISSSSTSTHTSPSTSPASPTPTTTPSSVSPNAAPTPTSTSTPTPTLETQAVTHSTDYETVTNTPAPEATNTAQASSGTSTTQRTTITIIIVIASCVAGVAIIWTLIRKWKFRPSAQFEDRMQPIDWQPAGPDDGPNIHRSASSASHGSFHSGSVHADSLDHDFTAGPTHLAPIGGYADLARGSSPLPYPGSIPGPQMQEALVRGPSLTRPAYDQYGVPLHHQGAYASDAYGGITGTKY